jgi:hypothetical protein
LTYRRDEPKPGKAYWNLRYEESYGIIVTVKFTCQLPEIKRDEMGG